MDDEQIKKRVTAMRRRIATSTMRLQELQRICWHAKTRLVGWEVQWDEATGFIKTACESCGKILGDFEIKDIKVPFPDKQEIIRTVAISNKIDGIRLHRMIYGSSLRNAKDAVEEMIGFPQFK